MKKQKVIGGNMSEQAQSLISQRQAPANDMQQREANVMAMLEIVNDIGGVNAFEALAGVLALHEHQFSQLPDSVTACRILRNVRGAVEILADCLHPFKSLYVNLVEDGE